MKKTNALQLRQNLGGVLKALLKDGKPILVERQSKPTAVLITIEDYEKRFVDVEADLKRVEIVERIKNARLNVPSGSSSLQLLHQGRK